MIVKLAWPLATVLARLKIPPAKVFVPEISDIEQTLADKLSRLCAVKWHQQVRFPSPFCDFFLDVGCLIRPGRAIGIECDGRDFHQDKVRDFCRDALMLGTGRLARIYRIEAWAIRKRELDWLRMLIALEPGLFDSVHLQTIEELGKSYDKLMGQRLQERYTGFMCWRDLETESVKEFLKFARAIQGITFSELVIRAKAFGEGGFRNTPP